MFARGAPPLAGGIPIISSCWRPSRCWFCVIYLGFAARVHDDDIKKALARGLSGRVALGGFVVAISVKHQRESLKYQISDNLDFRNITNNTGVLETIIRWAEEQACQKALLAFHRLASAAAPIGRSELERRIEQG